MAKIFTYYDNMKGVYSNASGVLKWEAPVVFICKADWLSQADAAYFNVLHKDPAKEKGIAVRVTEETN